MIIGGVDIVLDGRTSSSDVQMILRRAAVFWPAGWVETADGDLILELPVASARNWEVPCEFFLYQSKTALESWTALGLTEENANHMVSVSVEPDGMSFVISAEYSPTRILVDQIAYAIRQRRCANGEPLRNRILTRLREDLIGPMLPDEVLADRPTQRYSTAILYPRETTIAPEEDEDRGFAVIANEDAASNTEDEGVPLHATLKPSAAGLSFAIKASEDTVPIVDVEIKCATYELYVIDDDGNRIEGSPLARRNERWRRVPLEARLKVELCRGQTKTDLAPHGIDGLELYVLVTPHAGVLTVTTALSNRRTRGDSPTFDEGQHFFQVQLAATGISRGSFVPRPLRRATRVQGGTTITSASEEETQSSALIYRDVIEYVVGHTCSAQAVFESKGAIRLQTEWIPATRVLGVSDRGDRVFDAIRASKALEARWLADATARSLTAGLSNLVSAYRSWIQKEEGRVPGLPLELQSQAYRHVALCKQGADRMAEGVDVIETDPAVREAFQLAQSAMSIQFKWSRRELVWRPFQLAFQLLVIASLADRSHPQRDIMDLLWFPTGGGKTEAYLALTAFVIFLRRLKAAKDDAGAGVAVLMRYTLRLLTIQQFQRAAAMILACELLRRRASTRARGSGRLGRAPIGIGLWVGAAATPLTRRDALSPQTGSQSTPQQLTACPACGGKLDWPITLKESAVRCSSEAEHCELVATGSRLPIWTIDQDIYEHSPSLVIGTIDKFAQIVRKPETGLLFGDAKHAPPDLIIQDELHLISGPLGSLAGLYEIAIDELCRRGGSRPKVIGSTATIRRAEEQSRALFDRTTYQFPSPGLDAGNSGFAVVEEGSPGRLYVGVTTAGRSATYMLQALVATLLQAPDDEMGSEAERDHYSTLVSYFNSLRELGRALVLMQDDVPVSIAQLAARRGERRRKIEAPAELTSRVPAYEIRDMLERLKKPVGDPECVDLVVASNMISVGMDIPRLGLMVVNSQPKTLAEYIQATSRVGRGEVPGVVVTLYNSMRARDRSYYETFETWHRSLYRDVEPTSVTPFASRAVDKALHAVLVALTRHSVPGMKEKPILNGGRPHVEALAHIIERRVSSVDSREESAVAQKLAQLIDEWAGRQDLQAYWDDYGKKISLLMSAEQFAAKVNTDTDLDPEGARRALWPTLNSMRDVEPSAPFVLRFALKGEGS